MAESAVINNGLEGVVVADPDEPSLPVEVILPPSIMVAATAKRLPVMESPWRISMRLAITRPSAGRVAERRLRARNVSAVLEIFVCQAKKTFSTLPPGAAVHPRSPSL